MVELDKTPRSPDEIAQINDLVNDFIDAINRSGGGRQVALDALEFLLGQLMADTCTSEEHVRAYHDCILERGLFSWRRSNSCGAV